ncbi:MAG: sulfurtransferase, partial [Candidatus Thiodiazotropha weberae]|nr:sulfurtransferase [Candidatus Thiodiazotropha lotti]MCW4213148.1 rhodanese-like domain-containing protein [Candidatus Thiodiazotropha lotti]
MKLHRILLSLTFSFAILSGNASAAQLPGSIVDTQWLAKNLKEVQVIDVRSNKATFTTQPVFELQEKAQREVLTQAGGHIENAILLPYKSIRGERQVNGQKVKYLLPEKDDFEQLMQSAGLRAGKPIIIVSTGMTPKRVNEALRLFWQLKYFGEDNIAVLDGGLAAWLNDGHEVVTTEGSATPGDWKATATRSELIATPNDVSNADTNVQLVDARGTEQFYGINKRDYVSAFGHIRGAKMLPTEVLFRKDRDAVKFYSPEAYRSILEISEIETDQPTIFYCNSGHLAA